MSDTGPIFTSMRKLSIGTNGPDVMNLQLALNNRPPTNLQLLNTDGIFGPKTDARAREYQRNKGLVADGIVGPKTLAALAGMDDDAPVVKHDCSNPENFPMAQPRGFADSFRNLKASAKIQAGFAVSAGAGSSAAGSGPIRMLTDIQKAVATPVYGASLDFSTIFISNKTGFGGRPFTIAFNDGTQVVQIMNMGTFLPKDKTLIHELAHVWQSQHHSDKFRFMVNAIDSQTGAAVASTAAAIDDPIVILNKDFPAFFPFDAYAYNPGLPFSNMAAEQMAQAIEDGESAIVAHVKGVTMNVIDSSCIAALSRTGFADHRMPGVK